MLNKKSTICAIVASVFAVANVSAAAPGAYVGGALGYGYTHQFNDISDSRVSDNGIAGDVFGGYQFNKNFAAEIGFTKFHNATINGSDFKIKTYAIDIIGKGIFPLQSGFSVFGTLGAAYLKESASFNYMGQSYSESEDKVYPTFGAGVSYDINENVSTELSWARIQKVGGSDTLDSTDFFGLGLTYHFG